MAAGSNVRKIDQVPKFTTPEKKEQAGPKSVDFELDGVRLTLNRPKMVVAMTMLRLADGEEMSTVEEMGMDMVRLMSSLIGYVAKEAPGPDGELRGQAHLMHRLSDPDDGLDLLDLMEPFKELISRVFRRPTGKPLGSSGRPARTSRGGAAGTRSRRVPTSTS